MEMLAPQATLTDKCAKLSNLVSMKSLESMNMFLKMVVSICLLPEFAHNISRLYAYRINPWLTYKINILA